jgi:hypothetical protein
MVKREEEGSEGQEEIVGLTLDALARLGAQRMLEAALEVEVSTYVGGAPGGARCPRLGPGGAQRPCARAEGDAQVRDADGARAARG